MFKIPYPHGSVLNVNDPVAIFGIEFEQATIGTHVLSANQIEVFKWIIEQKMLSEIRHHGQTIAFQTRDISILRRINYSIYFPVHTECPLKNHITMSIAINAAVFITG